MKKGFLMSLKILNIFTKNKNNQFGTQTGVEAQKEIGQRKLIMMWLIMFLGYFLFVFQWYSISNFSSGWGQAFYEGGKASDLVNSVPNWMITFGRGIGSMLAGYFIAKFGHKYAVVFCLSLMVIAFPYIIVAQNKGWNTLSIAGGADVVKDGTYGTAVAGFSLFVIFRIFLAIGGTTLITYTNSVIAKMQQNQKNKYITLNSFGFNMGAFFGNIIFVIPVVRSGAAQNEVWTGVLSSLIVLIAILDIFYILCAVEVVPKEVKGATNFNEVDKWTFKKVFQVKENFALYGFFAIWLIVVVYSNSGTFRSFIETSQANLLTLVEYNKNNSTMALSLSKVNDYAWIWPTYISLFVISYFVSAFTVTKFNKTLFNRKRYVATLMFLGLSFLFIGLILVYVCGYRNSVALAFFLIFAFISGIFLWGTQPIVLFMPQQQSHSNAQYVGVVAGLVWGIGYFGYTITDASLSSIATYVGRITITPTEMATWMTSYSSASQFPLATGLLIAFLLFWVIMLLLVVVISYLPSTGYKQDGEFKQFTTMWNPFKLSNWKFSNYLF